MPINWGIGNNRVVSLNTDTIYSIAFVRFDTIEGMPFALYELSINDKVVMQDKTFGELLSEVDDLEIKNMTPAQKFEAFLEHADDMGSPLARWIDKQGNHLTLSHEDMQAVLALAKKGAKHE